MAESKKSRQYTKDITRFFRRVTKAGMEYPTYSGYEPWSDGYKAGYAVGKAKGIQQTKEKFHD